MHGLAVNEMRARIKTLREKAEHYNTVAAQSEREAADLRASAAQCDEAADQYEAIIAALPESAGPYVGKRSDALA